MPPTHSSQPLRLLRSIAFRLRRDGLSGAVRHAAYRAIEQWDEWRLGIKSSPYIKLSELGLKGELCHDYAPVDIPGNP